MHASQVTYPSAPTLYFAQSIFEDIFGPLSVTTGAQVISAPVVIVAAVEKHSRHLIVEETLLYFLQ